MKQEIISMGKGLYIHYLPEDAHAFDIDNNYLYYWRLDEKDAKIPLPVSGNWCIQSTTEQHIILRLTQKS